VNDATAVCLLRLTFHLLSVDNTGKNVITARRFRELRGPGDTYTRSYCSMYVSMIRPTLRH